MPGGTARTPMDTCPEHLSWQKVAPGLTGGQPLAAAAMPPASTLVTGRASNRFPPMTTRAGYRRTC
jgi:hypothetical protein